MSLAKQHALRLAQWSGPCHAAQRSEKLHLKNLVVTWRCEQQCPVALNNQQTSLLVALT